MPESIQHKLDRVRRPRVQITYDVETLGSIVKTELPFVVGIMADLSGNDLPNAKPKSGQPLLKDRKFVEIDRDNFDTIMEKIDPKVTVIPKATDDGSDPMFNKVELHFKTLEDFNPINVLRNVPELKAKFDSRTRLSNLVAKLDGDAELQKKFVESYQNLDDGAKEALRQYFDAVNPFVNRAARTPSVTNAIGKKGEMTKAGLVIDRNEADSTEVTHFKITDIAGGKLFKNSGADADAITAPAFIAVADGQAGLKFKRDADTAGSFKVQASVSGTDDAGLGGDIVTATITNLSPPAVTPAKAKKGAVNADGLVITPAATDTIVTHFKITGITGGDLFKTDGTSKIKNNDFITVADGAAGLKFKPAGDKGGSFKAQSSISATNDGVDGDPVTATITNDAGGQ